MKQVIARISPITNTPVIFDVDSRKTGDGRLKAYLDGKDVLVGYDFYMNTEHLPQDQALKIARAYAQHAGIPEHEIMVRQRFPKTTTGKRKTHDAALKLVEKTDEKVADKPETLQQLAQEVHDQHTKEKAQKESKKAEPKKEVKVENKATSANPEGAKVEQPKRRQYNRKNTKRSEAAMSRYLKELGKNSAVSETLLEAAAPGPGVTPAQVDEAKLKLGMAIAEILMKFNVL
jgi:hypothetical protein